MKRKLIWKLVLTISIIILAIYLATPLKEKIKLGLDLKGGIHLVLQVDTEDAINIETDQEITRLKELFNKNSIEFDTMNKDKIGKFSVRRINPNQDKEIQKILDEHFREWSFDITGDNVFLTMHSDFAVYIKDQSVNQALETIRNRVDQFGVAEPTIQRQGMRGDRLIVELPGVDNPERVKNIIKTTALLEWKPVYAGPAESEESLLQSYEGKIPEDMEVLPGDSKRTEGGYYLVSRVSVITGKDLRSAHRSVDEWNAPAVSFFLNPDGGRRFENFTAKNIGKPLSIILDNKIQEVAIIKSLIPANSGGIIQGRFTVEEAEDIALVLRAGALPAEIKYLEERTIGPSLGADSIRKGLQASAIALILVMTFMIAYYQSAGINAVTALILNMVLLMGALGYFRATLTIPGIAGIILSIGMAVDANVLIFERIKEELALAKSTASSIATGFSRAFSAILDSNVTTVISAIFLFQFGTGPVKGYAITLIIGITASMFTAIFVSRLIFDLTAVRRHDRKASRFLSTQLFKKTNINFMKYKYFAFLLSGMIIIAGLVNITYGKGLKLGIDFSGGALIRIKLKNPEDIEQIRQSLKPIGLGSSSIQEIGEGNREYLIRTKQLPLKPGQDKELATQEVISNQLLEALRSSEDKSALQHGLQDLNSLSESELSSILFPADPEKASEIAHNIISTRVKKGIIEDFAQLEEGGIDQRAIIFLKNKTFLGSLTVLSKETVGPQVGQTLRNKAIQATIWALIGMLIYIALRFKLAYGVSAILTLTHDVLVTLSIYSFTQREINLPVVAAVLTIVGFSLNDTIVIFDRIRDNLKHRRRDSLENTFNTSLNQTLSRSIITSGTVFSTVIALYFFGGEVINDFAFTMLVGVISGSYSTIYQSCPIVHFWKRIFK